MMVAIRELLSLPESQTLEWKRDFPKSLRKRGASVDSEKAELMKDLGAMANGLVEGLGRIVYGVADFGDRREIHGLSEQWDDAVFQEWSNQTYSPPLAISYRVEAISREVVGLFEVRVDPDAPHVVKRTIGRLHEGQVPLRRGTRNSIAGHSELRRLFLGGEPVVAGSTDGAVVKRTSEGYRRRGLEVSLPRYSDRDDLLQQGWRIALFPGTRRPVVVVNPRTNVPELIAMIKPTSDGG